MRAPARALACTLFALAATPAWADWQFLDSWADPIQNFETRAAMITNAEGYQLHLYRNPVGRVYALITLPEGSPDLVLTGPVATLTPEGFASKEIEAQDERGRVVEYAISTGRALRDRLWHGEGQAPAFGTFHDLLEAPSLSVTLNLDGGAAATTTWNMDSAAKPIAQALGISMRGIPAGEEWEEAASQAMLAAMTACQFPKLDVTCVQRVSTCSPQISDARDIDAFDRCVAAKD
ncbi:hypothetical protein [uncultured Tateyamaria sp.]|uniref:hypothetical protein n=1 Tax=uncultured Tateyamaria sp. TaxID=455651 RepID=UPI00262C5D17|nr:hypothetical protein [uncultured Tateyamaria sp.]